MELWIRSQDKEDLVKTNALYVMNNQIWNEVPFYENHKKIGLTVTGHNHKLAEYATKERALEVLDEINEIKYYKYMAQLDWKTFAISVLKPKPMEEQKLLLSMMNTYKMPKE